MPTKGGRLSNVSGGPISQSAPGGGDQSLLHLDPGEVTLALKGTVMVTFLQSQLLGP